MATFLSLDDEFDPQQFEHDPENVVSIVTPFSDARPLQMGVIALASSAFKINLGDGAGLGDDRSTSRLAITACYAAKDIQFSDAVEFSDSEVDFYGMPRMRISYSHTDADRALIDQMREVSVAVAERLGTAMDAPELAAGGSSLHYQGTVRMGPDRRRDVGLQSRARGLGREEPLPRRQRRHPHRDGVQPDPHHGRPGLARRDSPRRAPDRGPEHQRPRLIRHGPPHHP